MDDADNPSQKGRNLFFNSIRRLTNTVAAIFMQNFFFLKS